LGYTPITAQASLPFSFPKVGFPLVKINIFQRFKYRFVSAVLTVFETLKNIDLQVGEFPLSNMKPKRGLSCIRGIPQEKYLNA